jgi:hypothetical protein
MIRRILLSDKQFSFFLFQFEIFVIGPLILTSSSSSLRFVGSSFTPVRQPAESEENQFTLRQLADWGK